MFASREDAEQVLGRFAEAIAADPAIREKSRGVSLLVGYELPDLEVRFVTAFEDGTVRAHVGPAEAPPTIELAMDSDVFDQVFLGEYDTVAAAMSGELSFSGDVSAAMGMQDLMADFVRVYKSVRS